MATLTASKTNRKPAKKPERSATISTMTNGKLILWLTQDGKTRGYVLTPLDSEIGGTAYRLGKADNGDGKMDEYDVLLDGEYSTCECLGFLSHRHCKHLESLKALAAAGKLADPKKPEAVRQEPAPQQEPAKHEPWCSHCNDKPGVYCSHCSL
jgi:hypothetical protein